jgi:hypothetical protein
MPQIVWSDTSNGLPEDEWVAAVDPSELKNVWQMGQKSLAHAAGDRVELNRDVCAKACSPGADVSSVMFRAAIINILAQRLGLVPPDLVFEVVAAIPMRRMAPFVNGWPFDLDQFAKELEHAARQLGYNLPDNLH